MTISRWLALALVLATTLSAAPALACSCVADVHLISPAKDATDVPTDTAITVGVLGPIEWLGIYDPDGNTVPGTVAWSGKATETCNGSYVVVQPGAPLSPNTAYEVRSVPPVPGDDQPQTAGTFTTGSATGSPPPDVTAEAHLYRVLLPEPFTDSCYDGAVAEDVAIVEVAVAKGTSRSLLHVSLPNAHIGSFEALATIGGDAPARSLFLPMDDDLDGCAHVELRSMKGKLLWSTDLCTFEKCTDQAWSWDTPDANVIDWSKGAEGSCEALLSAGPAADAGDASGADPSASGCRTPATPAAAGWMSLLLAALVVRRRRA